MGILPQFLKNADNIIFKWWETGDSPPKIEAKAQRERNNIQMLGGGALRMMTEHHVLDLSTLGVGDLDKNSRWDDRVESQPE